MEFCLEVDKIKAFQRAEQAQETSMPFMTSHNWLFLTHAFSYLLTPETFWSGACYVSIVTSHVTHNNHLSSALPMPRDPQPAGGAVQVLGAAVGVPHPAAAGPAGVLPSQSGDRAGVLAQLGQAGGEVLLQNPQLQGAPTVQVSRPTPCKQRSLRKLVHREVLCKTSMNSCAGVRLFNMNDFSV